MTIPADRVLVSRPLLESIMKRLLDVNTELLELLNQPSQPEPDPDRWFVEEAPSPTKGAGYTQVHGPMSKAAGEQMIADWTARPNASIYMWQHPEDVKARLFRDTTLPVARISAKNSMPDQDPTP